ncbi:DUF4247 domain-containing protein [Planococcus glaciei]|nr:DUF4247 domain-containing protein [Planococcus glaciei]QDY45310.1 DUF4247 domain-containing protein [Planococcus glaciei]
MKKKKWLTGLLAAVLFLSACGSSLSQAEDYVENNYTFVNAVQSDSGSNSSAMLYRSDKDLAGTVAELSEAQEPDQVGEEIEGRQVLVYDDDFVILTEDPDNPGTTLVEVADEEFVRTHYNPGFFLRDVAWVSVKQSVRIRLEPVAGNPLCTRWMLFGRRRL